MKASSPPPHQQQPLSPPDIPSGSLLNLETLLAALDAIEIYISSQGREEIEDEERSGRPVTESTPENIEEIRSIISDDLILQ
ncbi:unnamed protein product [Rotaria sordida]|uniref:Uncharacterized protein n=1 Tax=Rotaria sordida TaxID=392033 RepID=A0A814W8Q5_9BILA|nr:unnamed protein product [Rotaria sordida]